MPEPAHITDAQQAKRLLLGCLVELEAAGFSVSGHWSGNATILAAGASGRDRYSPVNYAEIDWAEPSWTTAADELARMDTDAEG